MALAAQALYGLPGNTALDRPAMASLAGAARGGLVAAWRAAAKPRRQGAVAAATNPTGAMPAIEQWLSERGLAGAVTSEPDSLGERAESGWPMVGPRSVQGPQPTWSMYCLRGAVNTPDRGTWETAFHGTCWYAVRSILDSMVLLESDNMSLGHEYWEPGVYCSPFGETARTYAVPHALFGDSVYHRAVIELLVNTDERRRRRARGGDQWVFPWNAIHVQKFWVQSNAPPDYWESRLQGWEPQLDAVPDFEHLPGRLLPNLCHLLPLSWCHSGLRTARPSFLFGPFLGSAPSWCPS